MASFWKSNKLDVIEYRAFLLKCWAYAMQQKRFNLEIDLQNLRDDSWCDSEYQLFPIVL